MKEQENIELIKKVYSAFKRGDLDALLALFAHDFDFQHPMPQAIWPFAGTRKGRKGFIEFVQGSSQVIAREHFEADQFIAQGEHVVVLLAERMRAKTTGVAFDNPHQNRRWQNYAVQDFRRHRAHNRRAPRLRQNKLGTGQSKVFTRPEESGGSVDIYFCPTCGSSVFSEASVYPDIRGVAVGCFADPSFAPPQLVGWNLERHAWLNFPSNITHIETQMTQSELEAVFGSR